MTWQKLLAENRVAGHQTSKQEIDALRNAVARDLHDTEVPGISADTRFSLAYNAVLLLAKIAVACAGYRVKGHAAHHTTFTALDLAIGPQIANVAVYFDACRLKRNRITYDQANVVTDTETKELLKKAREFRKLIADWIAENHPAYA